tara:strand:- start:332 stop:922 length:591 start_codon:yes stop_codon:yes gene_type:complete
MEIMKTLKNLSWVMIILSTLMSCGKEGFVERDVREIKSINGLWELSTISHRYLKSNNVDTSWVITSGQSEITFNSDVEFDLVTIDVTEWDISDEYVMVGDDLYELNGKIYPSESNNPYEQCWDVNGNGEQDYFEDVNGDGVCDLFDCGPEGIVVGVENTVRVFNILTVSNNELVLEFEGQYFEDFGYFTTTLTFNK